LCSLPLCLVMVRFSGCPELFPKSHLCFFWECSPWVSLRLFGPASLLTTRHIWSEWTRAWWSLELVLRFLASDNKDLPHCLIIARTFWSECTRSRWTHLSLCNMPSECLEGFPN
jgi:hypothetical protein